jgi:hypothetical protein
MPWCEKTIAYLMNKTRKQLPGTALGNLPFIKGRSFRATSLEWRPASVPNDLTSNSSKGRSKLTKIVFGRMPSVINHQRA